MIWPWKKGSKKKIAEETETVEAEDSASTDAGEDDSKPQPLAQESETNETPAPDDEATEPAEPEPEEAEEQEEERFPEAVRNKATSWFEHAQQVAETKNYDYALELYCGGLRLWPEAVDEGIRPMYELGIHRLAGGGKKPGMRDKGKHPVTAKDAKDATANAIYMLSKEPESIQAMEAVLRAASRGDFKPVLGWIAPLLFRRAGQEKPEKISRYRTMWTILEKHDFLEMAFRAIERGVQLKPADQELKSQMKDIAALRASQDYEHVEDFRDVIKDTEATKALAEDTRLVKTEDSKDRKVAEARTEYENEPTQVSRLMKLVNSLVERRRGDDEQEAIELLEAHYQRTRNYRLKIGADDIRIRQLRTRARRYEQALAKASPDRAAEMQPRIDAANEEFHSFTLETMKERSGRYPTDRQIRFDYGEALFGAGKYDDAIPHYQIARDDPRRLIQAMQRIGESFYHLKYYQEAADNFERAIERYEIEGDDTAKNLYYWLGLTWEHLGDTERALKAFSQLAQWQFDYKDVRARLDTSRGKG